MEEATLAAGAIDAVGTTGYVQLGPNTMNSVPREARLEIDIRDIDAARRDATVEKVLKVRPAVTVSLWLCNSSSSTTLTHHQLKSRKSALAAPNLVAEPYKGYRGNLGVILTKT